MLALAGSLLQRLTGNSMASPEVLGVSAGTAFGLLCVLFIVAEPTIGHRLVGGLAGAAAVLVILFAMSRSAHSGNHFLILGVSLGAFLTALISVVLASGDPRALSLISWMAGSTYGVGSVMSLIILSSAIAGTIAVMLLVRPLQQFVLGDVSAHSHGVDVTEVPSSDPRRRRAAYCHGHADCGAIELCRPDGSPPRTAAWADTGAVAPDGLGTVWSVAHGNGRLHRPHHLFPVAVADRSCRDVAGRSGFCSATYPRPTLVYAALSVCWQARCASLIMKLTRVLETPNSSAISFCGTPSIRWRTNAS